MKSEHAKYHDPFGRPYIDKPASPRLIDPLSGRRVSLAERAKPLIPIWAEDDTKSREFNGTPDPVRDTAQYTKRDWQELRETLALTWGAFELKVRQGRKAPEQVPMTMSMLLKPFRHELGFVSSIATRVDELLAEEAEK